MHSVVNYNTLTEIYHSVRKYFQQGTLDDFMVLQGVLVAKNSSCFQKFEAVSPNDRHILDKRVYDTLKPFWKIIRRDPDLWNSYSYFDLTSNLRSKIIYRFNDDDKERIAGIYTMYKVEMHDGEKTVVITSPQAEGRNLMADFGFTDEELSQGSSVELPDQAGVSEPAVQDQSRIWSPWEGLCHRENDFYWTWMISSEQYDSLRAFLSEVLRGQSRDGVLRYAEYLSLYCAEWYKREYDGYGQGDLPVFRSLGVTGIQRLPRGIVGRVKRINLRGGNRYLDSLYIQGGLPWKYILSDDNTNIARNIPKLFRALRSGDADVDEIAQGVTNDAIRESILERGSIFENLNRIIEDEAYVQYIQEQFPGYETRIYEFVHAVRKEVNRSIFSLVWRFDRRIENGRMRNQLVPLLCFTSVTEKGAIPSSMLSDCGVDLKKCTRFNLVVRAFDEQDVLVGEKGWTYYRCANPSYYSTADNFDGRVIAKYDSHDQIPHSFKIFVEDVPGPFGIRLDNGFDAVSDEPIHVFESYDVIKLYGDIYQSLMYSNPKDAQLYVLRRDFIQHENEERNVSLGSFEFIPVNEPMTITVRGRDVKLSPYGTVEIGLSSDSLVGVVDKSCVSIVGDKYYTQVKHMDVSVDDVLLLSHRDLEKMTVCIGGDPLDKYNVEYLDAEGNAIEQMESYYGLATVRVSCGKSTELRVYLIDACRDLGRQVIRLNGCEYECIYDYQPENSKEFFVGDRSVGEWRCLIYYPFDLEDIILTYPIRKVYRSPRFYERSKPFYFTRTFDEYGCTESLLKLDEYSDDRYRIKRSGDGVFLLEAGADFPDPTEFYFYNWNTKRLLRAQRYDETDGKFYLTVPIGFRRYDDQDLCIVFQSIRDSHSDVIYRYVSPFLPPFEEKFWSICLEHHLQVEDYWEGSEDATFELLVSYLRYTEGYPDYDYLMNISMAKKFSWLMLGCRNLRDVVSNNGLLLRFLRETSPCKGNKNFDSFIELYISKIKRIRYCQRITAKTRIDTYAALVLSGELNVWTLSEEKRIEIYNYLLRDASYKTLMEKLNLDE